MYRDHHAWCPYCQKVWLWLEEKKVPYKVKKVTMFCYGEKESWYKKICPSGMLPALELDGKLITESDHILAALETQFGPLYAKMDEPKVTFSLVFTQFIFELYIHNLQNIIVQFYSITRVLKTGVNVASG